MALKVWVQCFSMQVVMNKCFLPNSEKMHTLISKNDIIVTKVRLL